MTDQASDLKSIARVEAAALTMFVTTRRILRKIPSLRATET